LIVVIFTGIEGFVIDTKLSFFVKLGKPWRIVYIPNWSVFSSVMI